MQWNAQPTLPNHQCITAVRSHFFLQVDRSKIFFKALAPEGGASGEAYCTCRACAAGLLHFPAQKRGNGGWIRFHPSERAPIRADGMITHVSCHLAADVGQSVVHYAKENGVDLVVLGARGMGSWKR